jgi:hypothetical protein
MSAAFDSVTLDYKTRRFGDWQDRKCHIAVEWTRCQFGGQRAWFLCPACSRRAAILYIGRGTAGRRCRLLVYPSQRDTAYSRALSKAQAIHEKLGGSGILCDPICKPKGMHSRTFWRLVDQLEQAQSRAFPMSLLRVSGNSE